MILPVIRRYLGIPWDEWTHTPWHDQRAIIDYLDQAEDIPFSLQGGGLEDLPEGHRPQVRSGVDAGTDVIDLAAMRASFEAGRRGGG